MSGYKLKFIILALTFSIFVLTLEIDPDLQKNKLVSGYDIIYKYEGQLSSSIDRFYVVVKFQLPKLNDISIIFKKKSVHYNNCDYLSSHNSTKYAHLWEDVKKWPSTIYMQSGVPCQKTGCSISII